MWCDSFQLKESFMASRARSQGRDMSLEEFDAWAASKTAHEKTADAADERGGPRMSLVPAVDQNDAWPTDLLPAPGAADDETSSATPFDGIPLESTRNRDAGWSADRQRLFLAHLAETGSVHLASSAARLSARGAYRLRTRSPAFARAWDTALQLAAGRLAAIAFDRAINGRIEQVYHSGELVGERRVPSDKLLMWLLSRLDPKRFALPWEQRGDADPQADACAAFESMLAEVADTPA
jgi:hypothetical protein